MPKSKGQQFPPQHQEQQPGKTEEMNPKPIHEREEGVGCGKLKNKVALITGGDSGIGRAVAIAFAQEGADVSIIYYNEHKDAEDTKKRVEQKGRRCITISGDVGDEKFCLDAIEKTVDELGKLDILINNFR
ncbi:MAG: hypothetical protein A2104_00400 [Candidatus Melainabacteria bacterium GWF2_32_7]|nr:MAG: hypothetical protein A2104_00400 [Candidatus Melainabacteria bacterium GWF2_32_7]